MASTQVEKQAHEHLIATIKNQTPSEMLSERYIKFTKPDPGPSPPAAIEPGQQVTFPVFVSKGAVVYTGHNREQKHTAWLMAWDNTTAHKVFVACGFKRVIDKMTDDEILMCLNAATLPEAVAADPISKTTVCAELGPAVLPVETLNASFGLLI